MHLRLVPAPVLHLALVPVVLVVLAVVQVTMIWTQALAVTGRRRCGGFRLNYRWACTSSSP